MSSASAPISSAWTVSAISSPAPTPTMPAPSSRRDPGSNSSLVSPSGAGQRQRAARGGPREASPSRTRCPARAASRLGQAHPGDLGVGVGDRRDRAGVELDAGYAGDHLGRDLALVEWPCGRASGRRRRRRSRRCDGTLVRIWRSTGMNPPLVDGDARGVGADAAPLGRRPTATRIRSNASISPSENVTFSPLFCGVHRGRPWSRAGSPRSARRSACAAARPGRVAPRDQLVEQLDDGHRRRRARRRRSPSPGR